MATKAALTDHDQLKCDCRWRWRSDALRAVRPMQKPTLRPGQAVSELDMPCDMDAVNPGMASDLHMT